MTLQEELTKRARVWASEITKQAHANLGNKKKLIQVRSRVNVSRGKIGVIVTAENLAVSEYGDKKIVARAYEYGSGIHGRQRRKYRIAPRRKKVLAFYWEKWDAGELDEVRIAESPKFVGFAPDGRLLFKYVDHPGVEAVKNGRGYMKPAIDKVRKQIRKEIPAEVRKEVIGSFRRAFKK